MSEHLYGYENRAWRRLRSVSEGPDISPFPEWCLTLTAFHLTLIPYTESPLLFTWTIQHPPPNRHMQAPPIHFAHWCLTHSQQPANTNSALDTQRLWGCQCQVLLHLHFSDGDTRTFQNPMGKTIQKETENPKLPICQFITPAANVCFFLTKSERLLIEGSFYERSIKRRKKGSN